MDNTPSGAVFLSYASQDLAAAQSIAEALKSAGIAVWFDHSELRGGDVWDRHIREQIRHCSLFIPVISANTEARDEGYFRREWNLACDRIQDMTESKPFLLPVVIDDTRERNAAVPDRFRQVQWIRLPGGHPQDSFVSRVATLLAKPPLPVGHPGTPAGPNTAGPTTRTNRRRPALWLGLAGFLIVAVVALAFVRGSHRAVVTGLDQSIAVLPFVDLSAKHDKQYLADGLAEELIDQLTRVPNLSVVARTSSFHFKVPSE